MTALGKEVHRLSRSLVASGSVTLALAMLAVAVPESTLVAGMLTVGLLAVLFGANQILTSTSIRDRASAWRLLLWHGVLSVLFGMLTVGATAMTFAMTLASVVAWLLGHAMLAIRIMRAMPVRRGVARALAAAALLDLAIAVLVVVVRPITILQFLFFGAVYAAVFGASQIAAGVAMNGAWLDRSRALRTAHLRAIAGGGHSVPRH